MRNYDDVMAQLRSVGLLVDSLVVDGRIHRCKVKDEGREQRGWYLLHLWTDRQSNEVIVGSYGVWHGNDNGQIKIQLGKEFELSKDELAAIRTRQAADRKRAAEARQRDADAAARRSAKVWAKALTAPPEDFPVDYLDRKGVRAHGLRYTETGALVIPMQDNNARVTGLQFILPSNHPRKIKTQRDKEYWPRGLAKKGAYYLFGGTPAPVLLLCEGYATGATLYEATGYPVAIAFDANNLLPVAQNLSKRYPSAKILVCADDDYLQRCKQCDDRTDINQPTCSYCGKPHENHNPGVMAAQAAALAVNGSYVWPTFPADRNGKKLTDYNDLQQFPQGGRSLVSDQIERKLSELKWTKIARVSSTQPGAGGSDLPPLLTIDEGADRFSFIYGGNGAFFDHDDRVVVCKQDVLDIMPDHAWREWKTRADRRVVRMDEVGFDPAGEDARVKCNLWGGWPTVPKDGKCEKLLQLLEYLCSGEQNDIDAFDWVLKWLAYPVQNPGAKMKTALVFHGGQGTGKNLFFETVMNVYGEYGRIVDQAAIEDKFNDWASKKLFLIADEVVARQELFHQKNKLKALITSDTIRINPKNVASREERNHLNIVFLSNERQPVVLEHDDRRYMVVWTPEKLDVAFYKAVGEEVRNGGVAALHDVLANIELGDFDEHTKPLMTTAKQDLMYLSENSEDRFLKEWKNGETGHPYCPCGSIDLYNSYQRWCQKNGVRFPRESNHFLGNINKMPGGWKVRAFHKYESTNYTGNTKMQKFVHPPKSDLISAPANEPFENQSFRQPREGQTKSKWMTDCFFAFKETMEAR